MKTYCSLSVKLRSQATEILVVSPSYTEGTLLSFHNGSSVTISHVSIRHSNVPKTSNHSTRVHKTQQCEMMTGTTSQLLKIQIINFSNFQSSLGSHHSRGKQQSCYSMSHSPSTPLTINRERLDGDEIEEPPLPQHQPRTSRQRRYWPSLLTTIKTKQTPTT